MAEIRNITNVEVELDEIDFTYEEALKMVDMGMRDLPASECLDLVEGLFERGDAFKLAMRFAQEIRGALDSDEEREVLEELDFDVPSPPEDLTTVELVHYLVRDATEAGAYKDDELKVIETWVQVAVQRVVNDFQSLRRLYRKNEEKADG